MSFSEIVAKWHLTPDGAEINSRNSRLLPVLTADGTKAILKIAKPHGRDEMTAVMLACYGGNSAVRLLRAEGHITLMERATGTGSLAEMALDGRDHEATGIICQTVQALHRAPCPAGVPDLSETFAPLLAETTNPVLMACAASARALLQHPAKAPLHGDIHHENILDSPRGWLAIDPKGRIGPPQYDFANLFLNPLPNPAFVLAPARMRNLASWINKATGIDEKTIFQAAHAHAGLSACWCAGDAQARKYPLAAASILNEILRS